MKRTEHFEAVAGQQLPPHSQRLSVFGFRFEQSPLMRQNLAQKVHRFDHLGMEVAQQPPLGGQSLTIQVFGFGQPVALPLERDREVAQ